MRFHMKSKKWYWSRLGTTGSCPLARGIQAVCKRVTVFAIVFECARPSEMNTRYSSRISSAIKDLRLVRGKDGTQQANIKRLQQKQTSNNGNPQQLKSAGRWKWTKDVPIKKGDGECEKLIMRLMRRSRWAAVELHMWEKWSPMRRYRDVEERWARKKKTMMRMIIRKKKWKGAEEIEPRWCESHESYPRRAGFTH